MYPIILALHNLLRWAIIITGIFVLYRNYNGWLKAHQWGAKDKSAGTLFTITLDSQLLVGLILYFILSPITRVFFTNLSDRMSNQTLRFFGVEHILLMSISIVLAHYTNSLSKKDIDDTIKFKRSALLYSFTLFLIILGIPWSTRPILPF